MFFGFRNKAIHLHQKIIHILKNRLGGERMLEYGALSDSVHRIAHFEVTSVDLENHNLTLTSI